MDSDLGHGTFVREKGQFQWVLTKEGHLHIDGSGVLKQDRYEEYHVNHGEGWDGHYDTNVTYSKWPWSEMEKKVIHISIGPNIKEIGSVAFRQYQSLKSLKISEGVEIIGDGAFRGTPLESISLPQSLKSIGEHAF